MAMKLQIGPIPLYYQLETIFRSNIASGDWPVGYKLPTETEIAKNYGLSVVTVKQALGKLVSDGLISRKRGTGTYVKNAMQNERLQPLEGSLNLAIRSEVDETIAKVFDYQFVPAQPKVTKALGLNENQNVLTFKRLHQYSNSKEPFLLAVNYIKEEIGRKIKPEDFSRSLVITILNQRHDIKIAYARQIMRAMVADYFLADTLSVNIGFPILKVERTLYSVNEEPLIFVELFYRGDRYIFSAELKYEIKINDKDLITNDESG